MSERFDTGIDTQWQPDTVVNLSMNIGAAYTPLLVFDPYTFPLTPGSLLVKYASVDINFSIGDVSAGASLYLSHGIGGIPVPFISTSCFISTSGTIARSSGQLSLPFQLSEVCEIGLQGGAALLNGSVISATVIYGFSFDPPH